MSLLGLQSLKDDLTKGESLSMVESSQIIFLHWYFQAARGAAPNPTMKKKLDLVPRSKA